MTDRKPQQRLALAVEGYDSAAMRRRRRLRNGGGAVRIVGGVVFAQPGMPRTTLGAGSAKSYQRARRIVQGREGGPVGSSTTIIATPRTSFSPGSSNRAVPRVHGVSQAQAQCTQLWCAPPLPSNPARACQLSIYGACHAQRNTCRGDLPRAT